MKVKIAFIDFWICIILISLMISPVFALGEGNRNLLLIGVMSIAPLTILRYLEFDKNDILLVLFSVSIVLFPMLNHPETMRWSTVMYSVMFCLNFMAFSRLLRHSNFTAENYEKLIKWIIYAFAIVLLIQQFCVATGLPIFNLGNYNPAEPWKLNTLSAEPSHSVRMLSLYLYSYIYIKEIVNNRTYNLKVDVKRDKWVWISFFWVMLTSESATGFIFLVVLMPKFFKRTTFIPVILFIVILLSIAQMMEIEAVERAYKTTKATLTLDEQKIMKADGSGASRIVPLLVFAKNVTIFEADGLWGHGVDSGVKDKLVDFSGIGYGKKGIAGSMFSLWYDYGFIAFMFFVAFSFVACYNPRDKLPSMLFWFMLVFLYGVNNQMVWVCISLLYTNKFYLYKNIKS